MTLELHEVTFNKNVIIYEIFMKQFFIFFAVEIKYGYEYITNFYIIGSIRNVPIRNELDEFRSTKGRR